MDLIRNVEEWNNLKARLPARYNLDFPRIVGAPNSYPCLAECFPVLDNNGYSIRLIFFHENDALKLLTFCTDKK